MTNNFEAQYGEMVINERLQFANRKGIYTWNSNSQSFVKINNATTITLKFPSRENQTINDAELILNSYSDLNTSFNNNAYWIPTNASLQLKRDNTLIFSLNLSNITFDTNTNFSMPTNADITIFTAPFTHNFQWRRNSSTEFQLNYNATTPQGCATSLTTIVKLQDSDYGNITSVEEDVKMVNGTLSQGNLKIVYSANVEVIAAFEEPTLSQINNNIDAEVFYNNAKIGDLIYDEINGEKVILIVYSDGTTENVENYVSDFQAQIETIFENYIND